LVGVKVLVGGVVFVGIGDAVNVFVGGGGGEAVGVLDGGIGDRVGVEEAVCVADGVQVWVGTEVFVSVGKDVWVNVGDGTLNGVLEAVPVAPIRSRMAGVDVSDGVIVPVGEAEAVGTGFLVGV
jgi:hypothetical protein